MILTIQTPTGFATIKDSQSKDGYKVLMAYIKRMQIDRVPFIVVPQGASVTDLHAVTSSDNIE